MPEITDFATLVLAVAAGGAVGLLATWLTARVPLPAPALFLVGAAVVARLWPEIPAGLPIRTVERIAVVALIVILFNGGMDMGMARLRASLAPVLALGLAGTFLTAGALALAAHLVLGMGWTLAGLLGAALAPTDPAVMFSVLGGREIRGRSGTTLEGEAGMNDPAGIALMLGMIELATHADATLLVVVRELAVELAIGTAFGLVGGRLLLAALRRVVLPSESLQPVLTLLLAAALYGVTTVAHGSGFLAVFLAGLLTGDAAVPGKAAVARFGHALAGLAELVVFVALGLTVDLSAVSARDWRDGLVAALVLAVAIRPAVVWGTLGRVRMSRGEKAFIAFSGLKGAVPILLAAFAVIGGVGAAGRLYDVVFVAVLASVVGQGTLVPWVAGRLGLLAGAATRAA